MGSEYTSNGWFYTTWKMSTYGVFPGPYFSVLGLNTERYSVSLRIQSECGKIQTRKNSIFEQFSRSAESTEYRKTLWKNSVFGHFSHSHWNKGNQCLIRRYYVHRWKCKAITCIGKIKFELTFKISSNSLSRSFFKDWRMGMGIITIVIRCANWYH